MVFSSTHNLSQVQFENRYMLTLSQLWYAAPPVLQRDDHRFPAHLGIEEPARNYKDVEFILMVGRNMMEAISTPRHPSCSQALDRGAKLVYLDPRYTITASKASEWIPIRPGCRRRLLTGNDPCDCQQRTGRLRFRTQYVLGCDDIQEAMHSYTTPMGEQITGVPASTIERIAREYAAAKPQRHGAPWLAHIEFHNSFQTSAPLPTLNALSGKS
jgi:thiosulfate reductase/polysulfide reductase chain A